MSKVSVIVGTRPEAIKLAPVIRVLSQAQSVRLRLVSTGQHREMLDQALRAFELNPDVDLNLMRDKQSLSGLTSRAIEALSQEFTSQTPDVVLVQGDTTTTLAASLAAFYQRIPVGHVEAGMRTGNLSAPWPEEMNRRLTAQLVTWHFAPLPSNVDNLLREGIPNDQCYVTGNTVVDALQWMCQLLDQRSPDNEPICQRLGVTSSFAHTFLNDDRAPFLLVTGHRRESFGEGIENLCHALMQLVTRNPQIGVVFPVHLNPAVQSCVIHRLGGHARIQLVQPMNYQDFVWTMQRCHLIISDSGGIQGEASTLRKPLLVTRETTEYPEASLSGGSRLVGTSVARIVAEAELLLRDAKEYAARIPTINPFGDGQAAERIVDILKVALLR